MAEKTFLKLQRTAGQPPAGGSAEAQPPADPAAGAAAPPDPHALAEKVFELWRRDMANERLRRGGSS